MKKVILIALMALVCSSLKLNAQTDKNDKRDRVEKLQSKKTAVKNEEKEKLKHEIEAIEERVRNNDLNASEVKSLKEQAAEKHARNIENKLTIIDQSIELLKRNPELSPDKFDIIGAIETTSDDSIPVQDLPLDKTLGNTYFGFGLQNAVAENGSLFDSPYKNWGSRYFEIGYELTTTLDKPGDFRLKYGIGFQFNGLKPKDEKRFYEKGEQTYLDWTSFDHVDKSKFRLDNLVVPIHLEFGPSTIENTEKKRYYEQSGFKIGIGGFAGLNIKTMQKLKYEDNGQDVKTKIIDDFNTNNFVYGLSAYIGSDNVAVYARYNLNTLFHDQQIDQNMFAIGLRFEQASIFVFNED